LGADDVTGEEYGVVRAQVEEEITNLKSLLNLLDEVYQLGYNDGVDDAQRGIHD
jgi:hypothetical protein